MAMDNRTAHRKPVLRLVPRPKAAADRETVDQLRTLLRAAEAGELIGFVHVGIYTGWQWDRCTAGAARNDPAWCAGMLQAFSAKLCADIDQQ
jgi:hypothetical protein